MGKLVCKRTQKFGAINFFQNLSTESLSTANGSLPKPVTQPVFFVSTPALAVAVGCFCSLTRKRETKEEEEEEDEEEESLHEPLTTSAIRLACPQRA
jgi:hypothetical protein